MGRKRKFSADLFEEDAWDTLDGEEPVEDVSIESRAASRKTARQRLEDYFEMKQLRQRLGEDPFDDYLNI